MKYDSTNRNSIKQEEIVGSAPRISIFLIASIAFVLNPNTFVKIGYRHISPWFIVAVGIAGILFCSFCVVVFIKRLFENRPVLIIDDTGIVYDTKNPIDGKVAWKDIEKISIVDIPIGLHTKQFIIIGVKNSDNFIANQKSGMKRNLMKFNMQYGGPISIISGGMKISLSELFSILTKTQKEHSDPHTLT